jgi:hypothetical protein
MKNLSSVPVVGQDADDIVTFIRPDDTLGLIDLIEIPSFCQSKA